MNQTTYILIAVLVFLGGVYWYFFTGERPEPSLTVAEPIDSTEQQFVDLAGRLDAIVFDVSIFSDPRFTLLTSIAAPVVPETLGRNDPFAPLGR